MLVLIAVLAGGRMGGMGQMMGGGILGMLLFWFLVVALLVGLIVWFVQQAQR